jgi:hypothetical protein
VRPRGRAAEVQLLGDRDEVAQLAELHRLILARYQCEEIPILDAITAEE